MNTLAFGLGSLGTMDMVIILALGLLLFGKRLPEVGKNLGKGIIEFKKGLKGMNDEIEEQSSAPPRRDSLPESEKPYRAPLDDGQDRRVSQAAPITEVPANVQPRAEH